MASSSLVPVNDKAGEKPTSRSYPYIGLEQAIKRASDFYAAEKRGWAPLAAAAEHWKLSPTSSSVKVNVAALVHFGLLESRGYKGDRLIRLTDRAIDLLFATPGSDQWRSAAISAVETPRVYQEILGRWPADALPSDSTLQHFLIRDMSFNGNAVTQFVRDFRASISFSGLDKPIAGIAAAEEKADAIETSAAAVGVSEAKGVGANLLDDVMTTPLVSADVRTDTIDLHEGKAVLIWPVNMSAESFEDFRDWLDLELKRIERIINRKKAP